MSQTPESVITGLLPGKSEDKKVETAEKVLTALEEAGFLQRYTPEAVEVVGARVPVECIEAYGLSISLDANGNAVRISSPWGLEVVE